MFQNRPCVSPTFLAHTKYDFIKLMIKHFFLVKKKTNETVFLILSFKILAIAYLRLDSYSKSVF